MLGMVPYVLDAFRQTASAVTPATLMLEALHRYDRRITDKEARMRSALAGFGEVEMSVSGRRIRLLFKGREVVELLRLHIGHEEGAVARGGFVAAPAAGFDYEMRLPDRSVYVAVLDDYPAEDALGGYARFVSRPDAPDVWLLTLAPGREVTLESDPVFGENTVRKGRLRTMQLSHLLRKALGADGPVSVRRTREGYEFTVDYA